MLRITLLFEGGILLLALALALLLDIPLREQLNTTPAAIVLGLTAGMLMTLVAVFVVRFPVRPLRQLHVDFQSVVSLFKEFTIRDLILVSLAAGICEEALFRGVLHPVLSGRVGEGGAIVLIAVVFGLLHAVSVSYVFFAGLLSVLLSLAYVWTDGLIAPILAHASYDAFALIYATRSGNLFADVSPPTKHDV